jgi:hypothetical protein
MQLADAAEAMVNEVPRDYFIYYQWMMRDDIPVDVTHIRIDSSVRAIKCYAFYERRQLRIVILNDGLEEIGGHAFYDCVLLHEIVIPNAVRTIKEGAFSYCMGLTTVTLGEGLVVIEDSAFRPSLIQMIHIPNTIREINEFAFSNCSRLTTVILGDGLDNIHQYTFSKCTSLEFIVIPCKVKVIHQMAFNRCTNLTNVEFCAEIEAFVSSEAMREWWNQGIHNRCLSTYSFLMKHSIPNRLGLVQVQSWQADIYEMLCCIPSAHPKGMNNYFRFIQWKLSLYESLRYSPTLLELAIWKSKTTEQYYYDHNNDHLIANMEKKRHANSVLRMQCRTDSITMVKIIVPLVFSFITQGSVGNSVVGDYDVNDSDLFDYNNIDDDSGLEDY